MDHAGGEGRGISQDDDQSGPARAGESAAHHVISGLQVQLARWEQLLGPGGLGGVEDRLLPAWRRVTRGEPRWQVATAAVAAIGLQLVLPDRFTPGHRLLPALELGLLVGLLVAHPGRTVRPSRPRRALSVLLIGSVTATNAWSAGRLVLRIVHGQEDSPIPLLSSGAAIWATNMIVFALWYWETDRGGPVARTLGLARYPDFAFPQMLNPDLAPPDWEPSFADYLYLSYTNATAFSPTDVLPFTPRAKMIMMAQSAVSLLTVVLVIARAVNIFK